MTSSSRTAISKRRGRRLWLWLAIIPAGLFGACWWFTEPLEEPDTSFASIPPTAPALALAAIGEPPRPKAAPAWPEGRLEGDPAKRLLLDLLVEAGERLGRIDDYTAILRKQERIGGELGVEQSLAMKVRHQPFAIYFKFLPPNPGKEVVYAEGRHDNKVIAHAGGWARRLIPRLAVPPDHPIALAENRHPITEAGLANLTAKLIGYRRMDLEEPDAVTILERVTGPDGRSWLRSLHLHEHKVADRPFARVEVLYDPDHHLPMRISSYDWPGPGHTGELHLAERYFYEDIKLDVDLTALDFDPANPDYGFHRF